MPRPVKCRKVCHFPKILEIAVTYENGQIFQHFGHTEKFKVYDVEEGKVVHSEVVNTKGTFL